MNNKNHVADLARQVFHIDSLREQILSYVLQKDGGSKEDACSLRLVQHAWMNDVSAILKNQGKPLYNLKLDKNNSLNESSYVQENGTKILNNFISTVALSPTRIENMIPPFSLSLDLDFFQDENCQSFSDFLTGASVAGLVQLEMNIPESGGSFDYLFGMTPFPTFPVLREVSVKFHEEWADEEDDDDDSDSPSDSTFIPFLQSVLVGASELKTVVIQSNNVMEAIVPAGIRYLTLPTSLTQLKLEGVLTNTQLESLATNSLPNLTHLALPIYGIAISTNRIFRILDLYRTRLRTLVLHGHCGALFVRPKPTSYIRFPVMESLQTFVNESVTAELAPEHHYDLQTLLPVLESVDLKEQSVSMLGKWTDNSCFETVTQLSVSIVNDVFDGSPFDVTVHLEEMQALHMAFPNVGVLDVRVVGTQTCGLKYVFREMTQLTQLTIRIAKPHKIENSAHWDSLLTGIPILMPETIAKDSQFWNYVKSVDLQADEDESSLKNLNALGSLSLIALLPYPGSTVDRSPRVTDGSLISDAAFHLAFLKMPNLKTISLEGEFRASPEMTQVWEAEHGSISYLPTCSDV